MVSSPLNFTASPKMGRVRRGKAWVPDAEISMDRSKVALVLMNSTYISDETCQPIMELTSSFLMAMASPIYTRVLRKLSLRETPEVLIWAVPVVSQEMQSKEIVTPSSDLNGGMLVFWLWFMLLGWNRGSE